MSTPVRTYREASPRPPMRSRGVLQARSGIDLQVAYPSQGVAVVSVRGVLDDASLPRFAELLRHRLTSLIDVLVVDLSAMEFVSISGLDLLRSTFAHANARGIVPRLVATTHAVRHALRAAGLDGALECHSSLAETLSTPTNSRL